MRRPSAWKGSHQSRLLKLNTSISLYPCLLQSLNPVDSTSSSSSFTTPPIKDNFHWALYLHEDVLSGGTKYHVKEQGSSWITDHGRTTGVLQEFLLVGLFLIARVPKSLEGHVDKQLRTYDASINTDIPGITCRVWSFWVLKLLQQPANDGWTISRCDNLDALEAEVKEWGNLHAASAAGNVQPRPVEGSSEDVLNIN